MASDRGKRRAGKRRPWARALAVLLVLLAVGALVAVRLRARISPKKPLRLDLLYAASMSSTPRVTIGRLLSSTAARRSKNRPRWTGCCGHGSPSRRAGWCRP